MERKLAEKLSRDLRAGCKCQYDDCPLGFLLRSTNPRVISVRLVEQEKCIEIFKLDESTKAGYDINRDNENVAAMLWVERGFSKRFADVYQDGKSAVEIYNIITSPNYKDKSPDSKAISSNNQCKFLDDKVNSPNPNPQTHPN